MCYYYFPLVTKSTFMKRTSTLLAMAVFCTTQAAHAQIPTGSTLIGGNIGLVTYSSKDDNGNKLNKNTSFNISPSFGNAYKTNRIVGVNLSYSHNKSLSSNSYGGGVFLRQYKNIGKDFYLFGDESLNANYSKYTWVSSNGSASTEEKVKTFNSYISLAPGVAYDVTRKLQIEMLLSNLISLSYSNIKHAFTNTVAFTDYKENLFSFNSSLSLTQLSSISIGVRFVLGRI